ncbi:MAG: V-type ATP synthase subunit D [Candidatus Eremiobacteraeota bacterium]|nr:V-type ATP synthase subunit D [Candidatus Eremiobacteraeota bacterium]
MGKVTLSKSSLQKERTQLKLYQKMLPSLDLKRQQLTLELGKAREEHEKIKSRLETLKSETREQLPMLAVEDLALTGLVMLESVKVETENIVGVKLPVVREVKCSIRQYSMFARPFWVDILVERLREAAELSAVIYTAEKRVAILEQAKRRITQRVNLFEKVLIPGVKNDIKRIVTYLGDLERTSVVRSKLAKRKQPSAMEETLEP